MNKGLSVCSWGHAGGAYPKLCLEAGGWSSAQEVPALDAASWHKRELGHLQGSAPSQGQDLLPAPGRLEEDATQRCLLTLRIGFL